MYRYVDTIDIYVSLCIEKYTYLCILNIFILPCRLKQLKYNSMTTGNTMKEVNTIRIMSKWNLAVSFKGDWFVRGEILITNNGQAYKVWNDLQSPAVPTEEYVLIPIDACDGMERCELTEDYIRGITSFKVN